MARESEELEIVDPGEEERPEYEIDDEEDNEPKTSAEEDDDSEKEEEAEGEEDEGGNLLAALQEERQARQELQRQIEVLVAAQKADPADLSLKLDFEDYEEDDAPTVAQVKKAIESSHSLNQQVLANVAYAIAEVAAWNRHGGYESYSSVTAPIFERAQTDENFRRELYSQTDPFEAAWRWSTTGKKPKSKATKMSKAKNLPKSVKGRSSKSPAKTISKMTGAEIAALSDEEQEKLLLGE